MDTKYTYRISGSRSGLSGSPMVAFNSFTRLAIESAKMNAELLAFDAHMVVANLGPVVLKVEQWNGCVWETISDGAFAGQGESVSDKP